MAVSSGDKAGITMDAIGVDLAAPPRARLSDRLRTLRPLSNSRVLERRGPRERVPGVARRVPLGFAEHREDSAPRIRFEVKRLLQRGRLRWWAVPPTIRRNSASSSQPSASASSSLMRRWGR